tara:strand:+ start:302 stop:985 length:684 start_codon:yes stop_codon:yes gene_type:complete
MKGVKLKNYIVLLALTVSISVFYTPDAHAIAWQYNLKAAVKTAEKLGKPVMVDFYTDWCGWCKQLDNVTYRDSKVSDLAAKFICVKIDGDKNPDLVRKYNIRGYPHILFLKSNGSITDQIAGYADPATFVGIMEKVLKQTKPITKMSTLKKAILGKPKKQVSKEPMPKKVAGFQLTGIIYNPNKPKAIINDTIKGVGDSIDGAKVIKITEEKVVLDDRGREVILDIK